MSSLSVVNVSKSFTPRKKGEREIQVLDRISFEVAPQEIVAIIGPSGCGKTTLLRIIAGLTKHEGEVKVGELTITGPHPDVAVVFQNFRLLPWRTTIENVAFGLELRGDERRDRHRVAQEKIELVGLGGFENYRPMELSGGMQQRVGLARALAVDPKVLLMDEPFGAVDQQTAERLHDELLAIQERTGKTIVIVTHDIDEAVYLSDRVIVLSTGPGTVRRQLDIDLPEPRWANDTRGNPIFTHNRRELRDMLLGTNGPVDGDAP